MTDDNKPVNNGNKTVNNSKKTNSLVKAKPNSIAISKQYVSKSFIENLEEAEKIADYIVQSDTFSTNFRKAIKDADGNITHYEVNKADVIACITLGNEIGISPMASIALGRRIDANAYLKVQRGNALGLDVTSALNIIYIIPSNGQDMVCTGVHVITKVMIDNGVMFTVIKDCVPVYKYYLGIDSNKRYIKEINRDKVEDENGNINSDYFLITNTVTADDLKKAKEEGKTPVFRNIADYEWEVLFERPGKTKPLTIKRTKQDWIDAGYYTGYHSTALDEKGNPLFVEGKPNWNNGLKTMGLNRVLTIGGRIVAGDRLHGIYSVEEVSDVTNIPVEDITHVELES